MEIRKCREVDVAATGAFYDAVVFWLDQHINFPKWMYKIYPSESWAREMTEKGEQYICVDGQKIIGAFVLNADPQGNYRKGNWELSTLRAISLWEFWIAQPEYGSKLECLTNLEGKRLFSVSGYAATRRAEEVENSEEAMRKNRRIDIRLTTRQATREELEQTLQPLRREMEQAISPQGEP